MSILLNIDLCYNQYLEAYKHYKWQVNIERTTHFCACGHPGDN
jgi:hypothetical protein